MSEPDPVTDVEKLWTAVKRDYFVAVETFAGIRGEDGDIRWNRLVKNWRALCAVDTDRAARLAHGLREVTSVFDASHRGPADGHLQELSEIHDIVRASIPEVDSETVGNLYAMGEEAMQRRIDENQQLV
ncbi:MAG: hypothetical protein ABIQ73_26475 [Acidimicrobiales bacterium]